MTDPRNSNPFATNSRRIKNELDANRELSKTLRGIGGIPADAFDIDPWNEWGTHDELRPEELERIEIEAEIEELRHNGYWD